MRNKLVVTLFSLCALTFTMPLAYASAGENLDTLKHELIQYHDSGNYSKDQSITGTEALDYLKQRVAEHSSKKLAIVLDIDETSLSNYDDMLSMNFGGRLKDIIIAEDHGLHPAIQPTLALYNYAKKNHVAVFFVTGRKPSDMKATVKNLKAAGFTHWNGLILKPEKYAEKSVIPYKSSARKKITEQGYDVVLSIGDQQSDLDGGYADKTFKLPNPYYLIP